MFYSRQLLARKAPLGQIWMAATTNEKINRKKLNKLDLVKICEEILNPSVPMALRLSGILMGGVVIVYQRKVKLLYDDVNRLLVELNQAWKVKLSDTTILPKGKSQAKYESITLPEIRAEDVAEMETEPTTMRFTQSAYFSMRLENLEDSYIYPNPEEDLPQDVHQANPADITLFESYDPSLADTSMHNRFERFDIEGDDTQLNFGAPEDTTIPSTLVPSPPPQDRAPSPPPPQDRAPSPPPRDKSHQSDEILDHHQEDRVIQQVAKGKEVFQDQFRQAPTRKRPRKRAGIAMDYEQTIIPGHIYQSWLLNTSDIISRRRKKRQSDAMTKKKLTHLMEIPLPVLHDGLSTYGNASEVHFPAPLLELPKKSGQPQHDSPSDRTTTRQSHEQSSTYPPEQMHEQDQLGYVKPFEDFHSGVGSQTVEFPIEKQREDRNTSMQHRVLAEDLGTNTMNTKAPFSETYLGTPGNSNDEVRSIPSSGSRNGFASHDSEVSLVRANKKRSPSSPRHGVKGLEPVAEESSSYPNFKLSGLAENGLIPDIELIVEIGPTQTQKHPLITQPIDQITHSIQMQLKAYFETPGSPKAESLNHLASGMDKKKAAALFFQTCVLATQDVIKVEQKRPYGEILISTGPKM